MKIVIFGLTISSSWGNGHATVWRGLLRELVARGHDVVFYEHNVPYYAANRDLSELPQAQLTLYSDWNGVAGRARRDVAESDVAIVTSYCPDAIQATELVWDSASFPVFYDLDTPVTLSQLHRGEPVGYVHPDGLSRFDLVLSFTGGAALDALRFELGASNVAALYGSVDPQTHRPGPPADDYRSALSYLGTYSADRQTGLNELFLEPARRSPTKRFVMAGAQYPAEFPWTDNIYFVRHLAPHEHSRLFCSSSLTLNVTRAAMRAMGWCPSGRLFEAAACGTPIITDSWEGLDHFFEPDREILIASSAHDVLQALDLSDRELKQIANRARERALSAHTAAHRAAEFEQIINRASAHAMVPA
jgi:spore maturation protein CgeB